MEENFEKKYHEIESSHFWFRSRRRYIRNLLKNTSKNASILDIGCSSGILLNELIKDGFEKEHLYGIDISEVAIYYSKVHGLKNTCVMDAQHIDLEKKFDVIIASDCLEHLKDDQKALNNWYDLLNPDGVIYIFVPAFMSLWSHHDKVNMHYRRYTLTELKMNVERAHFKINKSSYWNFLLFFPVFILRKLEKIRSGAKNDSGDLDKIPFANSLLYTLISIENKLLRYLNFPIGVSAFCIAKKKS